MGTPGVFQAQLAYGLAYGRVKRKPSPDECRAGLVEMGESRTPRPNTHLRRYATGLSGDLVTLPGRPPAGFEGAYPLDLDSD
jgi:hypothetical protein